MTRWPQVTRIAFGPTCKKSLGEKFENRDPVPLIKLGIYCISDDDLEPRSLNPVWVLLLYLSAFYTTFKTWNTINTIFYVSENFIFLADISPVQLLADLEHSRYQTSWVRDS